MSRRRRQPTKSADSSPRRFSAASLLFFGLIVGLAVALYYAWVAAPVVYVDASPARLSESHKAEYIFLVSQSYAVDSDWTQAQRRLAALDDADPTQTLTSQLERYVREGRQPDVIENLALLARQFGAEAPAVSLFAPTPLTNVPSTATASPTAVSPTNTPSPSPSATMTPRPTLTAVPTRPLPPTAQPNFRLLNQQRVCDDDIPTPRIEVVTLDALLDPLPGVEVIVNWDNGRDRFYTGFKPAQGEGYGDFTMEPDVSYSVILAAGSPEISGLTLEPCESGLDGGWRLTFQNLILGENGKAP